MRILAIETATADGSVALLNDGSLIREVAAHVPQRHLEWLAPTIEHALADAGWGPEDVEALAVSMGPGSFTGLRIGVTTAITWARARGAPIVGVPTLAALAAGIAATGLLCPLLDARRGEVAAALFRADAAGPQRLMDDFVAPLLQVLERLPEGEPVTFAGDALARYGDALRERLRDAATVAPRGQWAPRAFWVGRLAHARLSRGEHDDPYRLWPVYVRPPAT